MERISGKRVSQPVRQVSGVVRGPVEGISTEEKFNGISISITPGISEYFHGYLGLKSLGVLSETSKDMQNVVYEYMEAYRKEEVLKKILGDRFLGSDLLEKSWPADEKRKGVMGIPAFPDSLTVERIREAGDNHVLVCVPKSINGKPVTLMNLKNDLWQDAKSSKRKETFLHCNDPWYPNESFATRAVPSGWFLVRTDVVEASRNERYEEVENKGLINEYKRKGWRELDAGLAIFSMIMYSLSTGRNDMLNIREDNATWCRDQRDLPLAGYRVYVRFNFDNGLHLYCNSASYHASHIGCGLVLDFCRDA